MSPTLAVHPLVRFLHGSQNEDPLHSFVTSPINNKLLHIEPIPPDLLYVNGNGLDLNSVVKKGFSFLYEKICFERISSNNPEDDYSLILGPAIIDRILSKGYGQYCRPDAIRFDIASGSEWIITDFFEFKSGKEINGVKRKLDGFSVLLNFMRIFPEFLPQILKLSLPYMKKSLPDILRIPPDRKTSITFVSPKPPQREMTFRSRHKFRNVKHLKVHMDIGRRFRNV